VLFRHRSLIGLPRFESDTDVWRKRYFARGFDSRLPALLATHLAQATQARVRFLSTGEALHARPRSETSGKVRWRMGGALSEIVAVGSVAATLSISFLAYYNRNIRPVVVARVSPTVLIIISHATLDECLHFS
jgi:hypothetical protein